MTETILELPKRQADRPDGPSLPEVDLKLLEAALDYIRPAVQVDGGDLILLGVEEGVVTVQMVGACGGCPLSMMTLKEGIERILKAKVPGVVSVEAVA